MKDVVILSATRTAIGSFSGSLAKTPVTELGAAVIRSAVEKAKICPDQVNEVLMGCVLQAGQGQNVARQALLQAGLPVEVPATTVNMVCGSGLKSVLLAAQALRLGEAEIMVAGGMENMSLSHYLLPQARAGYRMGDGKVVDSMVFDGLRCAVNDYHMGITAENIAEQWGISREEQDAFSCASQNKAEAAIKAGRFQAEITPLVLPVKGGEQEFSVDEFPRFGTETDKLAKLRPAFKKDGTVTAGNASGVNDGAAALVLTTLEHAEKLGVKPLARIVAGAVSALEPKIMGMGPVSATQAALAKAGWSIKDLDLVEANEAFAVQSIAVSKELGFNAELVNVNGGAIALGHPIGASGARILVTLLHEMSRRDVQKGLATLCVGGGQGVALLVEACR